MCFEFHFFRVLGFLRFSRFASKIFAFMFLAVKGL